HQGRVYQLKHTNIENKQRINNILLNIPFRFIQFMLIMGSIYTNLEVDAVLRFAPHVDDCSSRQ
ncbi:hypothetical protein T4C_12844, partial [Trichinella pseudospiralis]